MLRFSPTRTDVTLYQAFEDFRPVSLNQKPNSPARILGTVSSEDRGEQVAETFLEFRATGRVVHFDALAFATDQAGFAQDFEMLGLDK